MDPTKIQQETFTPDSLLDISGIDLKIRPVDRMPEKELILSVMAQTLNDISAWQQRYYSKKSHLITKKDYENALNFIFTNAFVASNGGWTLNFCAHHLCVDDATAKFFCETIRRKVSNKTINFLMDLDRDKKQ